MNEREPHIVSDAVVTPDLADADMVIVAEATSNVDHRRGNVQVKRGPKLGEMGPLREGLEMVNRFSSLDFDDCLYSTAPFGRCKDEVGIDGRCTGSNRHILLGTWVDARFVAAPVPGLEQAYDPVVLELFADWPHEDWAHLGPPNNWILAARNP